MSKYHLSVLIPARNEYYYDIDLLNETVTNVLANTSAKTEIICVLDGYSDSWPKSPLPVNSRLTVIHHRTSIGQRAATNEAARIAQGEYVMKLDAHCALDENFDDKLLADFQPLWTVIPAQMNLLAFNWKCKSCGWLKDQSPKPARCGKCNSRYLKQVKVWKPRDGSDGTDIDRKSGRRNTRLEAWRFDSKLEYHPGGWGELVKRQTGPIIDTLSLLGACWAMRRERYYEIEPSDPLYGSWGQQGTEVACKTWLSGGELKCNTTTWFAHFFRTGGIGFPWPDGGRKERAMARCREQWLQNQWPLQKYPLSWLIERFWPVPDWSVDGNPVWEAVAAAGKVFRPRFNSKPSPFSGSSDSATDNANPVAPAGSGIGEQVPVLAMGSSSEDGGERGGPLEIVPVVGNQSDVAGIAAGLIIADGVIQDRNPSAASSGQRGDKPCVHEPMGQFYPSFVANVSVAKLVTGTNPDPAILGTVTDDTRKDGSNSVGAQMADSEHLHGLIIPRKPRKGCLYYTCNSHDPLLEQAARANLKRATNGHEIGCVSLARTDFGDWTIVLDREKSPETMHHQILAGLERSTADYVFLCESDVFYHPSHFEFTPPRDDVYYYNTNLWRVRYADGHAVRTADCKQVSGICCSRQFLLDHYRKRVQRIDKEGFSRRNGYEPGTRHLPLGYDNHRAEGWRSKFPNIDITAHGQTLTSPKFSIDEFRNKKYAAGWEETDSQIEGWPKIAGRVQEWLREMVDGE